MRRPRSVRPPGPLRTNPAAPQPLEHDRPLAERSGGDELFVATARAVIRPTLCSLETLGKRPSRSRPLNPAVVLAKRSFPHRQLLRHRWSRPSTCAADCRNSSEGTVPSAIADVAPRPVDAVSAVRRSATSAAFIARGHEPSSPGPIRSCATLLTTSAGPRGVRRRGRLGSEVVGDARCVSEAGW
jgi:hypothetical protein